MVNAVSESWLVKVSGPAAIAGAFIALALTPFMASVQHVGEDWATGTLLQRLVGPALEAAGLLTIGGSSEAAYEIYGKGFFLVYLLMVPAVIALHRVQTAAGRATRVAERSYRALFVALVTALTADWVSYWGISVPGAVGQFLWTAGFLVEMLALLVLVMATLVYGVISLRLRVVPPGLAVLLISALPTAVAVTVLITDYVPNSIVLPWSMAWAVIGAWIWRRGRAQPSDVAHGAFSTSS
jgi:hypothetical protein